MTATLNGTVPFDVVAARGTVADEDKQPFAFTIGEQSFELKANKRWPVVAQMLLADGKLDQAMALMLVGGQESWQRLLDAGIELGDLEAIFTAASQTIGLDGLGNSARPLRPGSTPT